MRPYRLWLIAALMLGVQLAYGQDASRVVCGVALNMPGGLSWDRYVKKARGNVTQHIDYQALGELLDIPSRAWPAAIRKPITDAFAAFSTNALRPSAFKIEKTADLPPKQAGLLNTSYVTELPLGADSPLCQNADEATARQEAAYFIILVERAHDAVIQTGMRLTAKQIDALEQQYDKYLFEGFPMFPWEAAANSWLLTEKTIAQGPPRNSIVLLHPAAGVIESVKSGQRSDTGAVLSIEPLGWIRYSSDFNSWYGASLLAVFPSDRNAGYGVALNYNNYKLGVSWHHDTDTHHDGPAIFLGMDLLQFVDKQHRKYDGYQEKVGALLDAVK